MVLFAPVCVLLVICGLIEVVAGVTPYEEKVLLQVDAFQEAMIARNATAGVSMFTANASWDIPLGTPSGHVVGRNNICLLYTSDAADE